MPSQLLVGAAALHAGCYVWHLQELCRRGAVPFERVGRNRVFKTADLPVIRAAVRAAGYMVKDDAGEIAHAGR